MNLNLISDQIADVANEAIRDALDSASVSSYDIDTDYIESIIESAVEERLKERESESAFTFYELLTMRQGVHKLRVLQIDIDAGKQDAYREFGENIDTEKFNQWVGKEADKLKDLYNKIDRHMNNVNARGE